MRLTRLGALIILAAGLTLCGAVISGNNLLYLVFSLLTAALLLAAFLNLQNLPSFKLSLNLLPSDHSLTWGAKYDYLLSGDLVFFNTRRAFGHVGIYIGNHEFVHASSRRSGVRIDSLDTPYYNKSFVKAVRLKDLDEEVL